jgi:hypothetical protein
MGSFILGIRNAPPKSKYWWGEYNLADPFSAIYSGWLGITETWGCPYGAFGATDLHVMVVDSDYNKKHEKFNLGPIHDGKSYVYDCSTGTLYEEITAAEFDNLSITSLSRI